MKVLFYIIINMLFFTSCNEVPKPSVKTSPSSKTGISLQAKNPFVNPNGKTIKTRFVLPSGYVRIPYAEDTYQDYLRKLPLKQDNAKVKLFNGSLKTNQDVHEAVVDLEIRNKDLHQCADAIMRLRAEYLWKHKKYDKIHFNFTNGFRVDYSEWKKGRRMVVKGNKTYWDGTNNPSNTYEDFWNYMELIFMYAGTLSLSKELKSVPIEKMEIGDTFILGGSPGHAVVVVDMAQNSNGKKIFLLAQSYMPAQETHVLKNLNEEIGPWYTLTNVETIYTPEWLFSKNDLKRFNE